MAILFWGWLVCLYAHTVLGGHCPGAVQALEGTCALASSSCPPPKAVAWLHIVPCVQLLEPHVNGGYYQCFSETSGAEEVGDGIAGAHGGSAWQHMLGTAACTANLCMDSHRSPLLQVRSLLTVALSRMDYRGFTTILLEVRRRLLNKLPDCGAGASGVSR